MSAEVWTQAVHRTHFGQSGTDLTVTSTFSHVAVMVRAYEGWDDIDGEEMTPDEAEAFANQIIAAAKRAEQGIADRDHFGHTIKATQP